MFLQAMMPKMHQVCPIRPLHNVTCRAMLPVKDDYGTSATSPWLSIAASLIKGRSFAVQHKSTIYVHLRIFITRDPCGSTELGAPPGIEERRGVRVRSMKDEC